MKKIRTIVALLLFAVLFQGCSMFTAQKGGGSSSKLVVQVEISKRPFETSQIRSVTDVDQIDTVLDYIGGLELSEMAEKNRDMDKAATCMVTYHYSDGGQKVIYLVGTHYCREGDSAWMRIDDPPKQTLLEMLE